MDKSIITDYVDACELVKETEQDIKLRKKCQCVYDKVSGSNPEFPYQPMNFSITGVLESEIIEDEEEKLLRERMENAKRIKVQAEKVINTAPIRMQRIIRLRIMQRLVWDEVAMKMGEGKTGDAYRMEFSSWLKEK